MCKWVQAQAPVRTTWVLPLPPSHTSHLHHLLVATIPGKGAVQAEQAQVLQSSHLFGQVRQPSVV